MDSFKIHKKVIADYRGCIDSFINIAAWLIEKGFDAVVWTGLPPKFIFQNLAGFSTEAAIAYLKSLTGKTSDKAFNYINTAPLKVKTPVREAAIKLIRQLESGTS